MNKTNEQARAQLREGDHLVSSRLGYDHHGIYVSVNSVIHYSGFADGIGSNGEIAIATLEEFCNGSDLQVKPHPPGSFDRQTIIDRAYGRLGENWYNVLLNNCEHFANWCVRGIHSSAQVNALIGKAAIAYGMRGTIAQQTAQTVVRHAATRAVTYTATSGIAHSLSAASLTSTGTLLGAGALASLSTVAAPVAIAVGVGYCLKELCDWF
jgi:hypothetical protein